MHRPCNYMMNKQELFKQADYTFQRGNSELAKKYLSDLLNAYPDDEAAWMLLARVVVEKERKIECYNRVLKINPRNEEAKLALVRVRAASNPTLPLTGRIRTPQPKTSPARSFLRALLAGLVLFLLFGTTTYVIALNNPNSQAAQILALATPVALDESALPDDVAPQTRAEVSAAYPQYALLVDTLLGVAVQNAGSGMDGAPERPGDAIITSDSAGIEAKSMLEKSLPQPGTMTTVTITERQITSWLGMEMKHSPDLPLSDVQIYLRDDRVQIWGMVNGSDNSTSALIVGELLIDTNKRPYFEIESMQIGQQVVPAFLVSQMASWLNQALNDAINENVPGLNLMSLKVTSGLITVSGTR
ncbi:hypothetical protein MASR2M66_24900 [Chloroflexota bacterium]